MNDLGWRVRALMIFALDLALALAQFAVLITPLSFSARFALGVAFFLRDLQRQMTMLRRRSVRSGGGI